MATVQGSDDNLIVTFCDWGKHRSVMAIEALMLMAHALGFHVPNYPTHLCKRHWSWACSCLMQFTCPDCAYDTHQVQMWQVAMTLRGWYESSPI